MTNQLITVSNLTSGAEKAVSLDDAATLSATRTTLEAMTLMEEQDFFLKNGKTEIAKAQESSITLSQVVDDGAIRIGIPTLAGGDAVDHYNQMPRDQKQVVFNNIQILRGLTITKEMGFGKTFNDLYSWGDGYMPKANNPRILTEVENKTSFNEVTHMLSSYGSDSGSLSLDTPFASAEANFEYEQSKSTTDKEVTEYLTARYIVRRVEIKVDRNQLTVSPDFVNAVMKAVVGYQPGDNGSGITAYSNLLTVFNEWGYYVPITFTIGGVLYSTDKTKITEFTQAETEKEEFGSSFKASFDGIGGGGSYKHAEGSETKTTKSSKYKDITINQVGGLAGTANDYSTWEKSLDKAINWNLASASKLLPSLVLISRGDEKAKEALNTCLTVLDGFNSVESLQYLQPFLNMGDYSTDVANELNPFA